MCQIHLPKLRVAICGKDKIPRDFTCEQKVELFNRWGWDRETQSYRSLGTFTVRCTVTDPNPRKSSTHRVFVKCKHCGKFVPAGRWAQHMQAEDHAEAAKEFGLLPIKLIRSKRAESCRLRAEARLAASPIEAVWNASPDVAKCM